MALTQAMCTSFKTELLTGNHNFTNGTDVFNLALFAAAASQTSDFGPATTNYSEMSTNEASGTNYTAGGAALTNVTPFASGTTAITDFNDLTFSAVTITSSGALIYNTSFGNAAVGVYNFGLDITVNNGEMTINFPTPDAANGVIRIA